VASSLVSGRDFLQIRDAARLLNVTEKTLRNWDRLGHLRAHRHPINGYRIYRVADLHALLDRLSDLPEASDVEAAGVGENGAQLMLLFQPSPEAPPLAEPAGLLPCHWSRDVALDPKHRPQKWTSPSTTVRRDWRKFPQEAHVLDEEERRYRRFAVDEIALLQGFEPKVASSPGLTERQRIAALGDAVPPPLARALIKGICQEWKWEHTTSVEICAGIGGLAEGGASAGLEHLLLFDASETCAKLLRHDRPWSPKRVLHQDIRGYDFSSLRGHVGLLSGGPPCQPWSLSGVRLGDADDRDLLGGMPALVATIQPEVFLFENVPGLAMFNDGRYLNELVWRFRSPSPDLRYGVLVAQLNAADFGVPQVRKRIFILGLRNCAGAAASRCFDRVAGLATHRDPSTNGKDLPTWKTVGDVLKDREDPGKWRRWIGGGIE
jgi:site-specific DNA-cytosine methylase